MEFFAEDMYRENIMDHYKNPRNHGVINNPDIGFADNNPLCGDEIGITVKLKKEKIKDKDGNEEIKEEIAEIWLAHLFGFVRNSQSPRIVYLRLGVFA